jgi:hypothetical protein
MNRTALILAAIVAALIGAWMWLKSKGRAGFASGARPAPARPATPGAAATNAATQGIDQISGVIIGGIAKTIGGIFTSQPNSTTWNYTDPTGFDSTGGGSYVADPAVYTESV